MSRLLPALCVSLALFSSFRAQALERQPNSDYRARREKLAASLDGGVLVLFAPLEPSGGNAINGYIPDKDFFYLTGWSQPGAALVIMPAVPAKDDRPARSYSEALFVPKRNLLQERWTGAKLGPDSPEVRAQFGFAFVKPLDALRDYLASSLPAQRQVIFTDIPSLGETSASRAGIEWLRRANAFSDSVSIRDANPLIGDLRRFKDAGEMALIRHATDATIAAHMAALKAIAGGVTERSIAALMTYELGKRGCERMAYAPIVGSGQNSTVLHYSADTGTLKAGELVVIDVGGECSLYASDITRTAPVSGKFTPRQRELYGIVLGAQRDAAAAIRPGKSTFSKTGESSIYKVAYDYIDAHGKDLHGKSLGQYFIHGITHYIGLDVHDAGTPTTLQPGMVFSIEPGIYIPEEGIGIRIEDDFWIDNAGEVVNLSARLPHTADEIEAAMRR